MIVYVLRHGQSEANRDGVCAGWADSPLTELGIQHAKNAGKMLRGIKFDKIFASDLQRARQTAENAIPNCEYEVSSQIREIGVGRLEKTPFSDFTKELRDEAFKIGYKKYGGESKDEFVGRVLGFRKKLEELECGHVAVFAHARWLRTFLDITLGLDLPRDNLLCGNCTIGIFRYENGVWSLRSWINQVDGINSNISE